MDSISARQPRVLWSFWLACGLAVTGGIAPILLAASGPNRTAWVAFPFGIAAMALAAIALTYRRGRPLATLLYFFAGIALVYGMLWTVAVPLRLAVVGTCPPLPAACPAGSELPLTSSESNGLAIVIAMGTLAILVAFFGLWTMYRTRPLTSHTPAPERRLAPVLATDHVAAGAAIALGTPAQGQPHDDPPPPTPPQTHPASSAPPPDPDTPALAPPPRPARRPRVKRAPKPQAELPPPVKPLELPAPNAPDEPPSAASSS